MLHRSLHHTKATAETLRRLKEKIRESLLRLIFFGATARAAEAAREASATDAVAVGARETKKGWRGIHELNYTELENCGEKGSSPKPYRQSYVRKRAQREESTGREDRSYWRLA